MYDSYKLERELKSLIVKMSRFEYFINLRKDYEKVLFKAVESSFGSMTYYSLGKMVLVILVGVGQYWLVLQYFSS